LTMALTRIVERESGSIKIDGIDINKVSMKQVREVITIIPQEPTMYKGTLQYNLDPSGKVSKELCITILKKSGLDAVIMKKNTEKETELAKFEEDLSKEEKETLAIARSNEDDALLNFEITGDNLSSGEKSLIQICRAILRKNKVVILDEATANIDIETEQVIQKLMMEEFKGCTMLTIAHRLQTIIKSDRIVVMSFGAVAEYDSPGNLL